MFVCVWGDKRNHLPRHLMMGIYCIELYFKVIKIISKIYYSTIVELRKNTKYNTQTLQASCACRGGGGGHKGKPKS